MARVCSRVLLRILHTPTNTGNHPQGLARAERELGLESRCVQVFSTWLDYEADEVLARAGDGLLLVEARRWRLLLRALRQFDVVHFNFGSSLLPVAVPPAAGSVASRAFHVASRAYARTVGLRDLDLLHRAGKRIIVTYNGDDARQGTGPAVPAFFRRLAAHVGPGYYTEAGDELKRRRIAAFDRYAAQIYFLSPDLGAFLPERAEFMTAGNVDARYWDCPGVENRDGPLVIAHAPSHRGIKGTGLLLDAVERLRAEGVQLDFRLIEGLPHAQAVREYAKADLLVDQLLVGWYGGLSVEFMALGKPVVCYVADEFADRYVPAEMLRELPIVHATAANVSEVIADLLARPRSELAEIGRRGRKFVERWHDPLAHAARLRKAYEGRD